LSHRAVGIGVVATLLIGATASAEDNSDHSGARVILLPEAPAEPEPEARPGAVPPDLSPELLGKLGAAFRALKEKPPGYRPSEAAAKQMDEATSKIAMDQLFENLNERFKPFKPKRERVKQAQSEVYQNLPEHMDKDLSVFSGDDPPATVTFP
jgi:hypothetical protein